MCVPDWPFYNKHPVKWLDSVQELRHPGGAAEESSSGDSKKDGKDKSD